MEYKVISSAEFAYPDVREYETASDKADVIAARGGYATFQVVLWNVEKEDIIITAEGFEAEIYSLYPVYIEKNLNMDQDNRRPHMPEREAPYYVYDALMPYRGKLKVHENAAGIYVSIPVGRDAKPGKFSGKLVVGEKVIDVTYEISRTVVPEETLKVIQGFRENFDRYHYAKRGTEEWSRLKDEYYVQMRRMHQNMMYLPGAVIEKTGEYEWKFDFSPVEEAIDYALAHGMKYFNAPSVGCRKSWSESTILIYGTIPAMSYEGYRFLMQYLPALRKMLISKGVFENTVMGVSDEPNPENCTEYRALCGLIRKIVPDIRLIDAMSFGDLFGALDVWVPLNAEYDKHMKELEMLRADGGEMWFYVCCAPRGWGYVNRFTDFPLLCTRSLFWGSYKYNLTGYLHWAVNVFMYGIAKESGKPYMQDPFTVSCPEHHNADSVSFLPPGDTHLLYPGGFNGNGEIQEPWMSMRSENQRESAEEYEMLKKLAEKDKAKADAICDKFFRSFRDISYGVKEFEKTRRELIMSLEETE